MTGTRTDVGRGDVSGTGTLAGGVHGGGHGGGHGGVVVEPIPLPETRSIQRARQLERRRRQRRRKGMVLLLVLATVGGVVTAIAGRSPETSGQRDDPAPAPAAAGQDGAPPAVRGSPPVLVAHQDAAGRALSLTVLVPAEDNQGGTLLLIPPGTMTEMVALGPEPVGLSLELGGPTRLRATVENLLGAEMGGGVMVMDDAALAAALAPVGSLTVQVPERVEQVDQSRRVTVMYEPGPTNLAPGDAPRFLIAKGRSNDLARLARHQVFWEAWLSVLNRRPDVIPAQPPEWAQALQALSSGVVTTRVLPVKAVGTGGQGGELYEVNGDELTRLVAAVFPQRPHAGPEGRPRVQVLNGTGAVGLADAVRDKLGAGFDVHLTGNAARFDYAQTEVVYYDRADQPVAERVQQALGVGRLVLSRRPLGVVDVTIVAGKDFRPD